MSFEDFDPAAHMEDIHFCYRILLGRSPDPSDLEAYGNAVGAGWTATTLVRSFLSSAEFKSHKYHRILESLLGEDFGRQTNPFNKPADTEDLKACYRLLLGRAPDEGGWATYSQLIEEGWTLGRLVGTFLNSEEFRNRALAETLDRSIPEPVAMKEGFTLQVYSNDSVIGGYIRNLREFEPHVTKVVKDILKPGATFVDIGANVGYFTILAGKIVGPEGRVFAFEPFSPNVKLIYLNADSNGLENVQIFPYALWDKRTAFVAYTVDTNAGFKEYRGDPEEISTRDIVLSTTLDESLRGFERVDVMKIDIEGSEYKALKGGLELIDKHHPSIVTEFFPDSLRLTSEVTGEEYLDLLLGCGYSLSIIEDSGSVQKCGKDPSKILNHFKSQSGDHIDILAEWG
jgi:FkbM family methyltransferase